MILVQCKDGSTIKLNPARPQDRVAIDHPYNQRNIRRVSIVDYEGHRVDLPRLTDHYTRIWIEYLSKNGVSKGERVSMRNGRDVLQVTLYFSDGRVVINNTE